MPVDETLKKAGVNIPGLAEIVGTLLFYYYPDQVGNYSVTASFAGMTYTTDNVYQNLNLSVYYKPSSHFVCGNVFSARRTSTSRDT